MKNFDLRLHINLPADAPRGNPHLIDVQTFSNSDKNMDGLLAVDAIVTTLYKWNPKALHNLLDPALKTFRWGWLDLESKLDHDAENWILRKGNIVEVCLMSRDRNNWLTIGS
jgi:hypothetical protein